MKFEDNLTKEEKELLKDFNKLNEKDQEFIMKLLQNSFTDMQFA